MAHTRTHAHPNTRAGSVRRMRLCTMTGSALSLMYPHHAHARRIESVLARVRGHRCIACEHPPVQHRVRRRSSSSSRSLGGSGSWFWSWLWWSSCSCSAGATPVPRPQLRSPQCRPSLAVRSPADPVQRSSGACRALAASDAAPAAGEAATVAGRGRAMTQGLTRPLNYRRGPGELTLRQLLVGEWQLLP